MNSTRSRLLSILLIVLAFAWLSACSNSTPPAPPLTGPSGTTTAPPATAGQAYSFDLKTLVTGGTPPYSCAIASGTLPAGLSLSGCVVSGTPMATKIRGASRSFGAQAAGDPSATVTFTVMDSGNPPKSVQITVSFTVKAATLAISPATLPGGTVGVAYSQTVTVSGGTPPYTTTVTGLPADGLSATISTDMATVTISGTPAAAQTVMVTVMATDSTTPTANTASVTYSIVITVSTSFTCPSPVNLTLCGGYTFALRGFNISNGAVALVGFFLADNAGHVVAGEEDINSSTSATGGVTLTITGGSYVMDVSGDGRGVLTLIYSDGSSASFRFVLESATNAGLDMIEEFDTSGTLASGIMAGPETPPVPAIPAGTIVDVPLEGYTSTGQRAALLGDFQIGSGGCNGATGSFNSLSGESVVTNVKGTVSTVSVTGSCGAADSNGRGILTITISGGTPFTDTTLHFVYYAAASGTTIGGVVIGESDPIGAGQPILSGLAAGVSIPAGGFTASLLASACPCIFVGHATTDGTVTTGHGVATIIRIVITASTSTAGTFTGIEDQNSGGTITTAASVSGSLTIDSNGVGTITPASGSPIHFVIHGDTLETLDESTGVETGLARPQNSTTINSPGSPYIGGLGLAARLGVTPATANVIGVVTPTGMASGSISGTVDVSTSLGSLAGAMASGSYGPIDSTGRGPGTANLTGGPSAVSVVIWVRRGRQFVVLDVQSGDTDPVVIGFRLQ